MKLDLFLLVCLLSAVSVGASESPYSTVKVTAEPDNIERCIYVKQVEVSGSYAATHAVYPEDVSSLTKHAHVLANKRLRKLAHKAGGDSVLVAEFSTGIGRSQMRGEIYRCLPKALNEDPVSSEEVLVAR